MTYVTKTRAPSPVSLRSPDIETDQASQHVRIDLGRPELGPLLSVLFLMLDEAGSMVLHVAAARPGEGTTTVARDIAAGAAATGWCRVALLDANPGGIGDARWPNLVELCERGESLKLRPSLVGPVEVDLGLLTGSDRPTPRIGSVRRVYGALRQHYSLIVVDCPAISAGEQTLTLASAADETILVMEAERTPLDKVRRAQEALQQRGAAVMGVVMNRRRNRIPAIIERMM